MSEFEPESQGGTTEGLDDEDLGGPEDLEPGSEEGDEAGAGWDETNDEPAQGEGGQDAV